MKLTQISNRNEEARLISFIDEQISAFIKDASSTDRVKFITPRKDGESGMYQIKLNRLLQVSTPLEAGEMYKVQMENDSRPFYYRPDYNQITALRKFSEQELADYKARKEAERNGSELTADTEAQTISEEDKPF